MSQKASSKTDSLKASLGDLLSGPLGEPIQGLASLRATYTELQSKADEELASTVELRAGDTDVSRHKKTVKEKEAELRSAGSRLEAASLKLGEEVCVAHGRGDLPPLFGLEEALASRAALSSLRTDYANLEPKPNAGLWAKGKAAAQRLVVSGKIVLQEAKANDLQKKLVQSAFERGQSDELSCTHTAGLLDNVREAYADVERRKAVLDAAKAELAAVETRCRDIQQSDTRVASIRQQAHAMKRDMVEKFRAIMDSSGCEGVAERLSAAYLELKSAEAEADAAAAKAAQEPKGFFGAIAKALSPTCPQCKKKGFKKIDSKVLEREDVVGMAFQDENGQMWALHDAIFAGKYKRQVQAVYQQKTSLVTYECSSCGHKEVRTELERMLKM